MFDPFLNSKVIQRNRQCEIICFYYLPTKLLFIKINSYLGYFNIILKCKITQCISRDFKLYKAIGKRSQSASVKSVALLNRMKGYDCESSASPLDWLASIALRDQKKSKVNG